MSDYYTKYQAICDPNAERFICEGLAYAVKLLGESAIPVKLVHLCRSTPIDPCANLKKDFQLTEPVNDPRGEFAIYVSARPGEYKFHGQLAHEVAHLLNARLFDAYVEGLNTVFAERLLKEFGLGHEWSGWEQYFREEKDPYYARTYKMMTEVWRVAGANQMRRFLGHAVTTPGIPDRKEICIDNWLPGFCPADRGEICSIIARYWPGIAVENARRNPPPDAFEPPMCLLP